MALAGVVVENALTRVRLRTMLIVASVALAVLNAADLITTWAALHVGAHEGNPLLSWAIHSPLPLLLKVFAVFAVIVSAVHSTNRVRAVSLLWFACGIYAMVVVSNFI